MVEVLGHYGMALLFSLPAWALWNGRVSFVFVTFALTTAMLPDIDLVLQVLLPVQHHGITHTFLFVTIFALTVGLLLEYGLRGPLERKWLRNRGYTLPPGALFLFIFGGLLVGGYSHVFADMLSAPDIARPLKPFWPVYTEPVSLDLVWYSSFWWNEALFLLGLASHIVVGYLDIALEHRWAIRTDNEG